jgi:hypothetical protein
MRHPRNCQIHPAKLQTRHGAQPQCGSAGGQRPALRQIGLSFNDFKRARFNSLGQFARFAQLFE